MKGKKAVFAEYLMCNGPSLLQTLSHFVLGMFALDRICSILSLWLLQEDGDDTQDVVPPDQSLITDTLNKILDAQETQLKALEYLVGFVNSQRGTDENRVP